MDTDPAAIWSSKESEQSTQQAHGCERQAGVHKYLHRRKVAVTHVCVLRTTRASALALTAQDPAAMWSSRDSW